MYISLKVNPNQDKRAHSQTTQYSTSILDSHASLSPSTTGLSSPRLSALPPSALALSAPAALVSEALAPLGFVLCPLKL